jgi:exoribonuclease II
MQEIQEAVFETVTELSKEIPLPESIMDGDESDDLVPDAFANIENDMPLELRAIMIEVATINEIIKTAKTETKRNVYKKKIAKLQKKAKVILFTQYLSGKNFPVKSSEISLES